MNRVRVCGAVLVAVVAATTVAAVRPRRLYPTQDHGDSPLKHLHELLASAKPGKLGEGASQSMLCAAAEAFLQSSECNAARCAACSSVKTACEAQEFDASTCRPFLSKCGTTCDHCAPIRDATLVECNSTAVFGPPRSHCHGADMRWSALCGPMDHTAPASMGLSTDSNATANATANASKTIDSTAPGFELFRGCSVQALPLVVHAFSDNILHCVVVCMVVRSAVPRSQLHLFRYRELIHAMMLGSSAKLAYLVALIWEYPTEYELLVELFVLSSTVLALSALRVCHSSIVPGLSLAVGCLARAGFSHASRLLWPNQLAPSKVLV